MIDLTGKSALVVGGTRGIGQGIALAFAQAGANVVAVGRDPQRVATTTASIRATGVETLELICDATQPESVDMLFAAIDKAWGWLDIVVNSQGTTKKQPAHEVSDELLESLLDVNVRSVFRVCREAYLFLKESQGCIINLASMASFIGLYHSSPYSTTKGGVAQMTKALALDWAADGIRCNGVAPGWILTPLAEPILNDPQYGDPVKQRIPMGRFGTPEDVAGAALYLASDLARYVTGSILVVDGGVLAGI